MENYKIDNKAIRVEGSKKAPKVKIFDIGDFKVKKEEGIVVMRGYANTKGKADRYGDIPAVFEGVRNYVYELGEFLKNPVMLLDHSNQVSKIAGSFTEIIEDEIGLRFTAQFSNSNLPEIAHARTVFLEGHGKALSIAGIWHFEDKENPNKLTYAEIFHISPVGVGADPNALGFTSIEKPPKKDTEGEEKIAAWKYCVCTKCGYYEDKVAGETCKTIKCPDCGEELTGSNEKPKKDVNKPEEKGDVAKTEVINDNISKEKEIEQKAKDLLSEMKKFLKEREMNTKMKNTLQEFKQILRTEE